MESTSKISSFKKTDWSSFLATVQTAIGKNASDMTTAAQKALDAVDVQQNMRSLLGSSFASGEAALAKTAKWLKTVGSFVLQKKGDVTLQ